MAHCLGSNCLLIEYGSGSVTKTRLLLAAMDRPAGYMPVDIARDQLEKSAAALAADYPAVPVLPVCADFTKTFALPPQVPLASRRAVYFPGSTIGNFGPAAAKRLLAGMAQLAGPGGAVLIGVDLKKDPRILEAAYDDAAGVTSSSTGTSCSASTASSAARFSRTFTHITPSTARRAAVSRCTSLAAVAIRCRSTASQSRSKMARAF